jgi:hypothetical protein
MWEGGTYMGKYENGPKYNIKIFEIGFKSIQKQYIKKTERMVK